MPHKGTTRITIILTVRDREKYISECIKSILNQSYGDFRFLIVDDNSTDRTVEIVEGFDDNRIECVSNAYSPGRCDAQNFAYELANTEFIANMDSDDIAMPERLERQIHFMDENPEVGVLGTYFMKFMNNKPSERVLYKHPLLDDECKKKLLSGKICVKHPTTLIRKSSIPRDLQFRPQYWCAEDYKFYSEISLHTKFANIPYIGLLYRIHNNNISVIHLEEQIEQSRQIQLQLCELMFKNYLNSEELKILKLVMNNDLSLDLARVCILYNKMSSISNGVNFDNSKKTFIKNSIRNRHLKFALDKKIDLQSYINYIRYYVKYMFQKTKKNGKIL